MYDANKQVVRQLIDRYNEGTWDRLDELVAPTYVHHSNDASLDIAQFKRGAAWLRKGMPDFRIDLEDMVAEGDSVAVRFIGRGTHTGSLLGETPTSKAIALHGQMIYLIADGRVAEDWEAMDEHDMLKQIGAIK